MDGICFVNWMCSDAPLGALGETVERTELGDHLRVIVNENWAQSERPILISLVPDHLRLRAPNEDYKSALGSASLKTFVKSSQNEFGYRVVEHPTQKAKVGLVPEGTDYKFPDDEAKAVEANPDTFNKSGADGIALLKSLAKLSDSDLDKITIPVAVLAKLFR